MKAFVINLDRRTDRMEIIQKTMAELDIAFERVPAIDGRVVDIWPGVDRLKTWIYDGFRKPTAGMIAAFFSHRRVWEDIVARNLPQALIFEDDVLAADFSPEIMNLDLSSTGIDLLRLEEVIAPCTPRVPTKSESLTLLGRKVVGVPTYGVAAYMITLEGAKKLLRAEKFWFNPDHFDIWDGIYGIKTGVMRPNMFKQAVTASDNLDLNRHPGSIRRIVQDSFAGRQSKKTTIKRLKRWAQNALLDVLSFLPRMVMLYFIYFTRPRTAS